MELSFRGAKYEHLPLEIEVVEGEVAGRYRGSMWRVHRYRPLTQLRHKSHNMTYRGIHYKQG